VSGDVDDAWNASIIKIRLYNMIYIVKGIRHSSLKSCTIILETEKEFTVREGTPRTNKGGFVLIHG
jgi:hypothetical protein